MNGVPSIVARRAAQAAERAAGRPVPAGRWLDPRDGHDWPDTGQSCGVCRKPLHPILVHAGESLHMLCAPSPPVRHWRLRDEEAR